MKSATELLKSYAIIIEDAQRQDFDSRDQELQDQENEIDPEDFSQEDDFMPEQDIEDNDPVAELVAELGNWAEIAGDDAVIEEQIRNFLKEHNYQIIPINGLQNTSGSI